MVAPAEAPLWLELVKAMSSPAVALIIGGATVWIARGQKVISAEQKRIAQDQREIALRKLNLELFERRLKVFEATWSAASDASMTETPFLAPPSMTNLYPEASFLFGPEVEAYMKEVSKQITALAIIRQLTIQRAGHVPPEKISELAAVSTWLHAAASTEIRKIFSPYLDFSHIK